MLILHSSLHLRFSNTLLRTDSYESSEILKDFLRLLGRLHPISLIFAKTRGKSKIGARNSLNSRDSTNFALFSRPLGVGEGFPPTLNRRGKVSRGTQLEERG